MNRFKLLIRLRWVILPALAIILLLVHRPAGCTFIGLLVLAGLFDFAIYLKPGGARKAAHKRLEAVKRESQRLSDEG